MLSPLQKQHFRRSVLAWYRQNRHDLPWRNTRDPYKILVSEVMLQQTQAERVKQKWPEFLREFPTLKSLSLSPASRVIRVWRGMGYNRRALYLHKTAKAVMEKHGGKFSQTLQELRALPGVGEYTARALLVFAFGKCYVAPDVNVLRILRRSFGSKDTKIRGYEDTKQLIAIGDSIVTPKTAYDLNQALMDLGRTVCTAKNPKSAQCPLHEQCDRYDVIVSKRLTKEPMFAGVPRRIWRGRIVELVRAQNKLSHNKLLSKLGIQKDPESMQWLKLVIGQLVKDGMLVLRSRMVAFP